MSRVGKMAIVVPKGVDVAITADSITAATIGRDLNEPAA